MKFLFISCLALFMTNLLPAQSFQRPDGKEIPAQNIDRIIKQLMDTAGVTGLCLGVINNDKVAYVKAYGYSNKALNKKNDTATSLYAASLAKPLFGYIVMQLVDKGLINLDTPIYRYLPKPLPEYANYKDLASDDRWKLITARQCLSHTTGFPNWREMNKNKKLEIFFKPGSAYSYSGEGIELLQLVVETITGRKLEDLAQENIFKPFGMYRSSFVWQPGFEANYALGHNINEDTLSLLKRSEAHAAGSMQTTIADYTRFLSAVLQKKRLKEKTWEEIFTPQIFIHSDQNTFPPRDTDSTGELKKIGLSYGLGWGLFNSTYGKAFFKEGQLDGWLHYSICFPGKKIGYVIMTNSTNGFRIFKELLEKMAGVTIPWKWENYIPYRGWAKLSDAQLRKFTGVYDGKYKAIITLENGQLKVESPTVNLPKTNIFPQNDHHLYFRIMDTDLEFVKGANGEFEKIVVDDEGDHYELKRVE